VGLVFYGSAHAPPRSPARGDSRRACSTAVHLVAVGIAIACATPADADTLLRNADAALFAAKADGRGTWRLYDERMQRSALSRAA
jgi:predicted signal transduction protein with EAL and GGDEF domain